MASQVQTASSTKMTIRKGRGTALKNYRQIFKNLLIKDSGQDLIEYALVAALVGLGSVAAISGLDNSLKNTYNGVGSALTNATA
ncbi:MAG TPA: hypothetical protein VMQ60_06960 [Acidobacteriaceae bacterium]|jgi:pilus assembly protein Flp/PilA|nr:hypothetical protein [Acidobacteriaceae bacterium]